MTDPTPEERVEQMLASIPPNLTKPCAVERNKDLAAALRHYRKRVAEGKTRVSLEWFYENHLKADFNGPSMTTVRRWSRMEDQKNG